MTRPSYAISEAETERACALVLASIRGEITPAAAVEAIAAQTSLPIERRATKIPSLVRGSSVVEDNRSPTPRACSRGAATSGNSSERPAGNVAEPQCASEGAPAARAPDQGRDLVLAVPKEQR